MVPVMTTTVEQFLARGDAKEWTFDSRLFADTFEADALRLVEKHSTSSSALDTHTSLMSSHLDEALRLQDGQAGIPVRQAQSERAAHQAMCECLKLIFADTSVPAEDRIKAQEFLGRLK